MKVSAVCKRGAISIASTESISAAAQLMRERHVGFLIVYRPGDELRRPICVLTDRDIVVEVTANKVDPEALTVGDLMTREPVVANETEDLSDVLQGMRMAGVRRVPVVDIRNALVGVIAIDDAFDIITGFMCDITGSVKNEQRVERRVRAG